MTRLAILAVFCVAVCASQVFAQRNLGTFTPGRQTGVQGRGRTGPSGVGPQQRSAPRAGDTQDQARNQGFIGRSGDDVRQNFRNMGGRQRRDMMFDMMVDNLNEMRDSRRRRNRNNRPAPPVRVRFVPAFDSAAPTTTPAVGAAPKLNELLAVRNLGDTQIEIDGRVATLTGTVTTDRSRRLAEQIVMLEPGIDWVENRLEVTPVEE